MGRRRRDAGAGRAGGSGRRGLLAAAVAWSCCGMACDTFGTKSRDEEPGRASVDSATAGSPAIPDQAEGPVGFRSVFPEGNFRESCLADADCDEPFSCLSSRGIGAFETGLVCSVPCTTVADCPFVFNEHCGDLTLCESGVCGFLGCM